MKTTQTTVRRNRHFSFEMDSTRWRVSVSAEGLSFRQYRKHKVYRLSMTEAVYLAMGQRMLNLWESQIRENE